MTLSDILRSAQNGEALGALARRFGLAPDAAERATQAMLPAFSAAMERLKQDPDALAGLIAEITDTRHAASFARPPRRRAALALRSPQRADRAADSWECSARSSAARINRPTRNWRRSSRAWRR